MPVVKNRNQARMQTRRKFAVIINSMVKGVNSLFSSTRLDKEEAAETTNMWLVEDGVLDKRPGTAMFGDQTFTDRPDGFTEYIDTDANRELIVVADGKAWVVTTSSKTEITGATFTQGEPAYFLQYNNLLYIANGVDPLARYDGSTLTKYTAIAKPTLDGTPLTRTGLTAGAYTYYYWVTATNSIGETAPSAETNITVNKLRDEWDASNYLTLGWADVSGATKYTVYMSDTSGFEVKLAEVTASTYVDDGTAIPNPYIEAPIENQTAGPLFTKMIMSGNRIWGVGDPDNPQRVYWTGTGVNRGHFGSAYGGGWIDLQKGGKDYTVSVEDYQTLPYVFMTSPDGHGSIWKIELTSSTINFGANSETITIPVPKKEIAATGASAPRSTVYVENDILYANKQGIFVLGNEPGINDVLRTSELSSKIRPDWRALSGSSTSVTAAYYWQARVLFAVASSAGHPNKIFVFDRERGAWIKDWTIGVSQFMEHTTADGVTHLLGIADDHLVEFDESYESDEGTAFTWRYKSARLPIVKNWTKFGKVKTAFIRVRNAVGNIDVTLSGTGRANQFSSISSATITPGASQSGFGWDQLGTVQFGATSGTPVLFATESLIKFLRLSASKGILRDIQWEVSGDSVGDRCIITGLHVEGFESDYPLPLSDKL